MAGGTIIPGEPDTLFQEPIINAVQEGEILGRGDTRGQELMDEEEFQAMLSAAIDVAEDYIDSNISPDRELAARYYNGDKFGNEVEGRSAVVATEVRDAILGLMPGMMRIFCGSTKPVEFEPNPGTPSEQADLQSDYVSHVIFRDNPGFEIVHDAIKDALQRKTGIFTWAWEEREMVTATRFTGLTEEAFALLQLEASDASDADTGLEYEIEVESEVPDETQASGDMIPDILSATQPGDDELMGYTPPMVRSGIVRRRLIRKRVRVEAVPPEEFIVTPASSRDLDRFTLVGRRQEKSIGELVALGHDEDEIRELIGGSGGRETKLSTNPEAMQRNENASLDRLFDDGFANTDPASEKVKYCVVYVLVDYDGDGIPERRKVCTVGESNHVIYNEVHDDDMVPFGTLCPDPEQHSPFGQSIADQTMDLQEIKSEILRGTLDSLSESIASSRAINKNNVNVDDALNPVRGALIRINGNPGENIMDLSKPFVGAVTLPVLAYLDDMKVRRTGINPASPAGIDPDALQSTAKEGVQAQVDASHDRTELIARIFAETGFSRLFRGVRNLVCRNQDFRRILRLNGKAVLIDPRTWNADLDVTVKAGTGRGMGAKKLSGLQFIMSKQQEFIEKYGIENPVCNLKHLSYSFGEIIRELGFSDASRFVEPYTDEMQKKAEEMQANIRSQPTPQQLLAQSQDKKTDSELQAKLAALALRREEMLRKDSTSARKADMDFALGAAKLLGEYGRAAEAHAIALRGENTDALNRLADDANTAEPALPAPAPAPAAPEAPPAGPQTGVE